MTEVELTRLVEMHLEKLVRIVKGTLRIQRCDAEDIVQKSLERIWRRDYNCTDPRVAAVLNTGIDFLRARGSYRKIKRQYRVALRIGSKFDFPP